MSNMSYCRWENTAEDLQDCADNFYDSDMSESEQRYRLQVLCTCADILESAGVPVDSDDLREAYRTYEVVEEEY